MLIRPGRRAIAYAQIEPIAISASTLPPVMMRLFTSERPSDGVVPRGAEVGEVELVRESSAATVSASTSGFTATITRK